MSRVWAIEKADYTDKVARINVLTLILTPEEHNLIGSAAAGECRPRVTPAGG